MKKLFIIFALMISTLFASTAMASVVNVNDSVGIMSDSDKVSVEALSKEIPFDAYVIVTSKYDTKDALDAYLRTQVTAPNMIVVGLDPVHHRTVVHFGNETNINVNSFNSITKSGDPYFKNKQWGQGVGAIIKSSAHSVGVAKVNAVPVVPVTSTPSVAPTKTETSGTEAFLWIFGISSGALIIWLIARAILRSKRDQEEWQRAASTPTYNRSYDSVSPNVSKAVSSWDTTRSSYAGRPIPAPPPTLVIEKPSNTANDMITGGLLGYELGKASERSERRRSSYDYTPTYTPPAPAYTPPVSTYTPPSRSSSSRSSSSDYGSSSSSSSSSDWGSSSSSSSSSDYSSSSSSDSSGGSGSSDW